MSDAILRFFKLYRLPPGRRIHALEQVAERAREVGLTSIAEHADMAAAEDRKILDKRNLRRADRKALYGEEAVALDSLLDRTIHAFESYVILQAQMFDGAHSRTVAARLIRKKLMPQSANAITKLTYVEQHAEVNRLLAHAEEADVAEAVAELPDARPLLDHIAEINVRYGASLGGYTTIPSAAEIKADNDQGNVRVAEIASMIFAYFAMNPDADRSQRDHLLEPIERQNMAMRDLRRRRRAPVDLDAGDPDADLDLPDPNGPDDAPDTADAPDAPGTGPGAVIPQT